MDVNHSGDWRLHYACIKVEHDEILMDWVVSVCSPVGCNSTIRRPIVQEVRDSWHMWDIAYTLHVMITAILSA